MSFAEMEHRQSLPNGTSFDLIRIKAGSFFIGNSDNEIQVPDFYLAKYPVTQALWLAVMGGENPAHFKGTNRPVEQVSWYDAAAFCNALNRLCDYPPRYFCDASFQKALDFSMTLALNYGDSLPIFIHPENPGYRLPSESAWEYAATGASQRSLYDYAGGNTLDELGWYGENSHRQTQPVGLKLPNELGLYDLSGNVWEWCEDQYQSEESKIPADGTAWTHGDAGAYRVLRGGSWPFNARFCRSSLRDADHPASRNDSVGFRVMLFPPPVSWPGIQTSP
ncbi:formylglycine-generating enzyme family protein [Haliscomenobacter sp.]|uniref:formylglycine-generating enzyme family protein n=1 Tax=Haliscomenobacter sp. TaxID=2717303 RepID=UPI0035935E8A